MPREITAAIIQAQPEYYNLAATTTKAADLIHDAARKGANLITFGETWFSGYPIWLDICPEMGMWDYEPTKEAFADLYENSPTVDGDEISTLRQLAAQLSVVLVLSINERTHTNRTLYNSLLTIDATGEIINHHRKLVPTFTERIVWGMGDGAGLQAVDTQFGRVGGLICWEHWMPLARQAMHDSYEQIHVAVWPTVKDSLQIASRHYAFEGRTYVLAAGSVLPASAVSKHFTLPDEIKDDTHVQRGGSTIIAPDGEYIVEPVYDQEVILTAELDLRRLTKESLALDVSGHYARPDVFEMSVNRKRRS